MSIELEHRVSKMEWTLENHASELKELRDVSEDLRTSLRGIQQTLTQIKWFAMGGSCLYLADQFGLSALFKLLG